MEFLLIFDERICKDRGRWLVMQNWSTDSTKFLLDAPVMFSVEWNVSHPRLKMLSEAHPFSVLWIKLKAKNEHKAAQA
ncbi:hypothetical protein PIB30_019210 [Stylosanthes scabra]|uniref:Uncharacterized protein n=1 Tax=Stylosanthes scabra TaxID=79078 RepID=A0ABU6Q8Z9_9FABA|nr:hypothetical protein [Stylosanthes scabra]